MSDPALSPQEASNLLSSTAKQVQQSTRPPGALLYIVWGGAWVVGYTTMWASTLGSRSYSGPAQWAIVVMIVCFSIAGVVTAILIQRSTWGIGGASSRYKAYFGLTWLVAFVPWWFSTLALDRASVSPQAIGIVMTLTPVILIAVIYCAASPLFGGEPMFVAGAWLGFTAIIASFMHARWVLVVIGVVGMVGFVVAAVVAKLKERE